MSINHDLFPLVVDHVYIWVSKRAPEMQALRDMGLYPKETINVHTGQGSASQVVLFKNMYLELAWIEDESELAAHLAGGGAAAPVRETWKQTGVSPFGVGFHYRTPDAEPLPLGSLIHHAMEWMPEDSSIEGIPQLSRFIPNFFILHGTLAYWESRMDEEEHPVGIEYLTDLQITVTSLENPDVLTPYLTERHTIRLKHGAYPLMELTFDHHRQGKTFDLRPTLPLIITC